MTESVVTQIAAIESVTPVATNLWGFHIDPDRLVVSARQVIALAVIRTADGQHRVVPISNREDGPIEQVAEAYWTSRSATHLAAVADQAEASRLAERLLAKEADIDLEGHKWQRNFITSPGLILVTALGCKPSCTHPSHDGDVPWPSPFHVDQDDE